MPNEAAHYPDRCYTYRTDTGRRQAVTRDEWLHALAVGIHRPRPPEWWLRQQEEEGRSRRTASIIWGRHYGPDRRLVIWDQAPDADWISAGHLTEVS